MKRRLIHQINHPFDPHPFEAFWCEAWQPVERLKIVDGVILTSIVEKEQVVEEDIPMSHLRVRSRKALPSDCISFLRPGVDVCVLSASQNSSDEKTDKPVWIDAKIRSIERKHHDLGCDCQFFISFYVHQGPDLYTEDKKLRKATTMMKIDAISILQQLEQKPCETQYYRWCFSEDCSTVQKIRLFGGRFSADVTWLLVASVMKKTAFDIRTVQNHIAYEVSTKPEMNQPVANNLTYTLNFKVENEMMTPVVVEIVPSKLEETSNKLEVGFCSSYDHSELRRSKRRVIQPERFLAIDKPPDYDIEITRLGENKTYSIEYHNISTDDDDDDRDGDDDDEYIDTSMALSVQADDEFQKYSGDKKWSISYERQLRRNSLSPGTKKKSGASGKSSRQSPNADKESQDKELALIPMHASAEKDKFSFDKSSLHDEDLDDHIGDIFFRYMNSSRKKKKDMDIDFDMDSGGMKATRRRYHRTSNLNASLKKNCVYVRETMYDVRSFRKGSVTAQLCRNLIKRCMSNIDATLRNEPIQASVMDQWKEYQSTKFSNKNEPEENPSTKKEEELSEIDMLWKEMELALASWYLFDNNEDTLIDHFAEVPIMSRHKESNCEHDFTLNEQVGTVCRLCGFVETDIKDILPPFAANAHFTLVKDPRTEDDSSEQKDGEDGGREHYCIPSVPAFSSTQATLGEGENNVWALIPDLKDKLRIHQKRAFEFLWRNIAGSLRPSRMEKKKKKRGGCVISHSPGAGKTLLIIAFLVSYLKLFPGSRPLVLAPKTTLYTWYKEIIKWKVPIPVYQIHGGQTYKGEVLKQRMRLAPGLPKNQDVLHVLDCLEKMQRWLAQPSILLMGYTSFLTLTREDSHYAHRKYMAQLLKQCPGILILDEGHNPRSTKSRLRKGLMKVNTRLRILLSGTVFQNNFGEYFNTLCLARPIFVNEVVKMLDPKYEKRNEDRRTQYSLENRGRKLLIDKISNKINSNKGGERAQALKTLKKLTSKFINVYEGGNSDELPGLQCYTLMMKPTSLQQELLTKLQNQRPVYKGFPLELELLITLGAIHPWLIKTTQCSSAYFSPEELDDLDKYKFDLKMGSKVRFVMNLIPRCLIRNEKVLIFCHNIAPINLFLQIFERFYGWRKGREMLVLQGDIELFERGRVMDKFEEPGGPSKIMLASITACAEGISLVAASRVILLDSEWNPSKSKQAIARAFRPGQNKVVYVYQLLATGTLEEEKHSRTTWKEWVSDMIFIDEHVADPSHWQAPKIEDELLREIVEEDRATLFHKIMKNEKASNVIRGKEMMKKIHASKK